MPDRDCRDCKYCFCECGEDIVCGHPESYEVTSFGLSVNASRRPDGPCGPDGKLFEIRTGQKDPGKESFTDWVYVWGTKYVGGDEIYRRCQKILPLHAFKRVGVDYTLIHPGYYSGAIGNRLTDKVWIDYPTDNRTVTISFNAMDGKAFVERLLEPRHAWEQDGNDWLYIDIKDQRILGEVYSTRAKRFSAGSYLSEYRALGRFTSLGRAKQAVEEACRPQGKMLSSPQGRRA